MHPPIPGQQFVFRCRVETQGEPIVVEVPVELASPVAAAKLDQVVELPAPLTPIRLTQYLPRAVLEQNVVPDKSGKAEPGIQVSIDGPTQSHQRWLVANDSERNRLASFIGTWRYMSVADKGRRDELFRQFLHELTRDPLLVISRVDGSEPRELPLKVGEHQRIKDLGCQVRVQSFYHHYSLDEKTKKPINLSDKRMNPAALVEIEQDGKTEQRWVFAKFPDFKKGKSERLGFRVVLDCPAERKRPTPAFMVVTIGRTAHEVWTRYEGKSTSKPIALDKRIEVAGSQYTFHIAKFVPSGRLIEKYRRPDGKGGVPALCIETTDATGARVPIWLGSGKQRVVPNAKVRALVSFGPRRAAAPHGQKDQAH